MARDSATPNGDIVLKALAAIIKEVGISNFFVIFLAGFLLIYSTDEQKSRFISYWILLESPSHLYCYIVVVMVTTFALIGGTYYRRMLKLADKELLRIGQEKSDLQEALVKSTLSSSKRKT